MTAATDFLENEILDHILAGAAYTSPSSIHMKLHTGNPGEAGTANAATETTRATVTFGTPAASGQISNTATIDWTDVSTSETITHFSLWDAASGGNALIYGAFTASISLTAGDNLQVAIGDLDITLA